jgi:hypothetical protein
MKKHPHSRQINPLILARWLMRVQAAKVKGKAP